MKQRFFAVLFGVLIACGACTSRSFASSSALLFSTPPQQITEGDRITIDINVRSPDQSINAVSGTVLYPESLVNVVSVSKDNSIVNLWTREPTVQRNRILFEGIILNPGFQGQSGTIFHITFEAKKSGTVKVTFTDGAVLANDGLGTNIAATLGSSTFHIAAAPLPSENVVAVAPGGRPLALPVITDYSATVDPKGAAYVKGKGEPNALTKIVFQNTSFKSLGEQFIEALQSNKKTPGEVLVKNDSAGEFEYTSQDNLLAGSYNATPFLVDANTKTEKPGLGVQLLVSNSQLVRALVVVINVLALLIPIVGLVVVIYFIPWYSFRRMRVIRRKLGYEEEKIQLSQHELERKDTIMDRVAEKISPIAAPPPTSPVPSSPLPPTPPPEKPAQKPTPSVPPHTLPVEPTPPPPPPIIVPKQPLPPPPLP